MAYDVKKTDHLFIPFNRLGSALRDSKNNTKIYKDIKTLEQHNKKSQGEEAWLTRSFYVDVVEYAPVVHGVWIPVPSSDMMTGKAYKCSECGKMRYGSYMPNYCQCCGAKMDGEKK